MRPAAPIPHHDSRTGMVVLHSNRLENLSLLLTQFLQKNPLPPLCNEVVLVQSNGMKHWLELQMAQTLGICAGVRIDLPNRYLWQLYRQLLGDAVVPERMPLDKDSLVWRLMRLLPEQMQKHGCYAPIQHYLQPDNHADKLYQLCMQVADVFDGYQNYRADWLTDWLDADHVLHTQGSAQATEQWQAQLWRDIAVDLAANDAIHSRASLLHLLQTRLQQVVDDASHPMRQALPPRLVVFGISSLPQQTIHTLEQLAKVCQVLVLVQNPCQQYWGDLVPNLDLIRRQLHGQQHGHKGSAAHHMVMPMAPPHHHPLLASWGKQGRDYLHLIDEWTHTERIELYTDPLDDAPLPSQLQQLQSHILNLTPAGDTPWPLAAQDESMQWVSAHSPQREVEALFDQLWHWFDADDSLSARDVIVMVPDMGVFLPCIQAVFGRFGAGDKRHIPWSVADTSHQQQPLVQALSQLLHLPQTKLSLADWMAWMDVAAVRSRFGLHADDFALLNRWLDSAGVRWGLDATHRLQWGWADGMPDLDRNTWAFGLRRLLLGYATGVASSGSSSPMWQGVLAQAGPSGLDGAALGGLIQWLDAVDASLKVLAAWHTPTQWHVHLTQLLERFFSADTDADQLLIDRCQSSLDEWLECCTQSQLNALLPLSVVRTHWLSQLDDVAMNQRFFGGGVQFATLMPMRSIPFRVVALLGMNDGDYPRQRPQNDFDLMQQHWRAGDRSRREDDRYLFLEALLCARDRLYVSWQGHRITDHSERPPSVLVAQLLDHVNAHWHPKRMVKQVPLQPFSSAYAQPCGTWRTYDADWSSQPQPQPQHAQALPCTHMPETMGLEPLQKLLRHPVRVFYQDRLHIKLDTPQALDWVDEPFEVSALQRHQLIQHALTTHAWQDTLPASGELPLAGFGLRAAAQLGHAVQAIEAHQRTWQHNTSEPIAPVRFDLQVSVPQLATPNGTHTVRVQGVSSSWRRLLAPDGLALAHDAHVCIHLEPSNIIQNPKPAHPNTKRPLYAGHRLVKAWVEHVVACASSFTLTSVVVGVDGCCVLKPLHADAAQAFLQQWLVAYAQAWQAPLPAACKTGWVYVAAINTPDDADEDGADDLQLKAHKKATTAFEGSNHQARRSELASCPYLQHAFAGYDDIQSGLPHWANELYQSLWQHIYEAD